MKFFDLFKKKTTVRSQDSFISPSGAGSDLDRGVGYQPGGSLLQNWCQQYGANKFAFFYKLYRENWEAKKIVNIPAQDMTREGWRYESPEVSPENLALINAYETKLNIERVIFDALLFERLYGGAVVLIITQELSDDPSEPLNVENISRGALLGLKAVPRPLVFPEFTDIYNLYQEEIEFYTIINTRIHQSRLLIFDGGGYKALGVDQFDFENRYNDNFGDSVLESLFNDIINAAGGRQAAFHLMNLLSIPIFQQTMQGNQAVQANKVKELERIQSEMSIYRGVILEEGFKLENYTSKLSDMPKYIETQLQVLSAASDIPAPRFLGQAPGGLNATGKGDLVNYYDGIKSQQVFKLKPQLEKLKPILIQAALGNSSDNVDIVFNPLMQITEEAQVESKGKYWEMIREINEAGFVNAEWMKNECKERGIFLNELPEQARPSSQLGKKQTKRSVGPDSV